MCMVEYDEVVKSVHVDGLIESTIVLHACKNIFVFLIVLINDELFY